MYITFQKKDDQLLCLHTYTKQFIIPQTVTSSFSLTRGRVRSNLTFYTDPARTQLFEYSPIFFMCQLYNLKCFKVYIYLLPAKVNLYNYVKKYCRLDVNSLYIMFCCYWTLRCICWLIHFLFIIINYLQCRSWK